MRFEAPSGDILDIDVAPHAPLSTLESVVDGRGALLVDEVGADLSRRIGTVWDGSRLGRATAVGPPAVVELVGRAGVDAGGRWCLAPGGYDLTGSGGPLVFVEPDGAVTVWSVGLSGGCRTAEAGQTIEAGGTTWYVQVPDPARRPDPVLCRRSFNRPPRRLAIPSDQPVDVPVQPDEPTKRARMGWAMLIGPVLMGAIMAIVFRPIMAVIALVGPLMMGTSWAEDRLRIRRVRRENAATWAADLLAFDVALDEASVREVERRTQLHPWLPAVVRCSIEMGTTLWERRPHHPDYLRVSIGLGRTVWEPPLRRATGADLVPEVRALVERRSTLPSGPVEVDLAAGAMIGVVGDRRGALALVRALLVRLATHHGPADLRLAIVADQAGDWEWCSWLPHTRVDTLSGRCRLGANPDDIESVITSLMQADDSDLIAVVDASGLDPRLRARLAALVDAGAISALVIEPSAVTLPGSCDTIVTVAGAYGVLHRPSGSATPIAFTIDGAQVDVAGTVARHLYALDDPEEASEGSRLPARIALSAIVGRPWEVQSMATRWVDPPEGLIATVGMTEHGPLTIDLVADGPHGLVAGTTGSGKSEFLRSLIGSLATNYGPDRVTFALVDYKGGSAFDSCAGLPHVVGLVTDLDRQLGKRALRSLEAELRHREEVLRLAGVDDIRLYPHGGGGPPLPRLLVIIDEFAALAADLPEFVPSLVDIAQRGRSLGVHMILATQRPAGVVNESIRANTNLRVALRVQAVADSRDVIDDPVAARLPRRFPGRGFMRLGPGELVPFQTASSSATVGSADAVAITVRKVRFGWEPVASESEPEPAAGTSELERLTEISADALAMLGWQPPRAPWAQPLPDLFELGEATDQDRRVIGLVDEPDRQCIDEFAWNPDDGGLLAFGVEGSGASDAVIAGACAAALVADPGRLHIYGLDGGGGALGGLEVWPHVGGIARVADRERAVRVVRRLFDLLNERRRGAAQEVMVLVVVERLGAVLAAFDSPGDMAIRDALTRVLVDGPSFGMFPLMSAARPGAVPSTVASSTSQRLCFRLADPFEYAAAGLTPRDVPDLGRGRGFDASGRMIQVGRPSSAAIRRLAETSPTASPPAPIGVLPDRVPLEAVAYRSGLEEDGRFLPVGLGDRDLLPVGFRLHSGDHVLIAGPARSGRTTTLASIARLAAAGDPLLEIIALARAGSVLDEAVGRCSRSVDELVGTIGDRSESVLVLIDDAERVDHPALNDLLGSHTGGLHVIAAGRADALRGLYQHWTREVRRCRLGLSLRPEADLDGELWQTRFPRQGPSFHQPGRGYLVSGGDIEVVQVAAS